MFTFVLAHSVRTPAAEKKKMKKIERFFLGIKPQHIYIYWVTAVGMEEILWIDLRSDVVTKPSLGMREAMFNAEVGDDVFGEDPTVNELQDRCAKMLGMEAALFVPSGTMANLIAILCHCERRGLDAIVGHKSHILLNEQGGMAQFAGVTPMTIRNLDDGTFSMDELRSLVRSGEDFHHTRTALICLENTHNYCGGRALPIPFLKQVYEFAKERNIIVHMDGARVLNAATTLEIPVSEITKYCHSVCLCFSKCLAAPAGSVIAGNQQFIAKAIRMRKALGGGMRQVGILAAAAIYSLDHVAPRLKDDHRRAKQIAKALLDVNDGTIDIDLEGLQTNIILIEMLKPGLSADDFCSRVTKVTKEEACFLNNRIGIRMLTVYPRTARLVIHYDLTAEMVELAIAKLQYVVKEFNKL